MAFTDNTSLKVSATGYEQEEFELVFYKVDPEDLSLVSYRETIHVPYDNIKYYCEVEDTINQ